MERPMRADGKSGRGSGATTKLVWVGIVFVAMAGCAGVEFREAGPDVDGIRYYRPATYFLIKPDYKKASASITTFHGPDTCRVFAAKPYAVFANNTTELHFAGGMLQKVTTNSDATAVPAAVTQAVAALGKEALRIAAEAAAASATGGASALRKGQVEVGIAERAPPVFLFVSSPAGVRQVQLPFGGVQPGQKTKEAGSNQDDLLGCRYPCHREPCPEPTQESKGDGE